ncbi:MAG TPA: c-type cytochrome [Spongiibacteraceae bacterium]|jgi:cytochrome c|nr:c-type cytochrome [Spongiibacteraceae bacterium]HUH38522.1 c-type cytochrome [Spongiibacteraceae bacterium]
MKPFIVLSLMLASGLLGAQTPAVVGDAERGQLAFGSCRTCHYPEQGVGHHNGPGLWNIFALKVGSQEGFAYSEALRRADFVWTPALMDVWLADPAKFLPGNTMMALPIDDPQKRADIIAYLLRFTPASDENDQGGDGKQAAD